VYAPVPEISAAELSDRLDGAVVLDVRQPQEFEAGHIQASRLIPLHELPDRLGELPTSGEVFVVCTSGSRSYMASEYLRENGIAAVNLAGGLVAWVDCGLELVAGAQPA
jgi:rhodanese-related sulfurtransferase